jgi:hypothetical protein
MAQTSVKTIEEQIDFEMSKLEIDFNNGVQWSMRIIHKSLLRIKRKAEQAEELHKKEIEQTAIKCHFEGVRQSAKNSKEYIDYGEQYYNETFNQ